MSAEHPGDGIEDHRHLASLLSEHDLAFAKEPSDPEDPSVFEVDDDADPDGTFPQSVASGGPTAEGCILWTRVDPEAHDPDEPLGVEVAADPDMEEVLHRGVVDDAEAVVAHDHTVKVDLDGRLEPDETYHYRFVHDGVATRVGRCHTLPAPDEGLDELSLVVLTCQNYANGYYGAYGHIAEEDADFILHVGDFIYESVEGDFKGLSSPDLPDRQLELPSGEGRVQGLPDYRHLHRTYRTDDLLQGALEQHTLVAAWDDHEIADDVHWNYEVDAPEADHPRGDDPEFMAELTADAFHAWWEYMPARIDYHPEAERIQDRFQLWRTVEFGDLVKLVLTDERLFRSPQRELLLPTRRKTAPENEPPGRTMLGSDQLEWFVEEVEASAATWTVWSDEVLTVPFMVGAGPARLYPVQGGWDGYRRERQDLKERIAETEVNNLVTLTGDMHCYVAGYKQTEYRDLLGRLLHGPVDPDKRIGVEFMTPAMTSLNGVEAVGLANTRFADAFGRLLSRVVTAMNPHLEYFNSHQWGYSVVEFTREDCTYRAYAVDKLDDAADADRELVVALRAPEGTPDLQDVTDEIAQREAEFGDSAERDDAASPEAPDGEESREAAVGEADGS